MSGENKININRADERNGGGTRKNRHGSKDDRALRLVYSGRLTPVWSFVLIHGRTRDALTRWGLAEFQMRHIGNRKKSRDEDIVFGRLTPEGVKVRDDYHARQAEKADLKIRREKNAKRIERKRKKRLQK